MTPAIQPLPPLRFERHTFEKVWGGRRLAPFLGLPGSDRPWGESWEVCDRDEAPSVVRDGPLTGTRLRDLVARRGVELLGHARPAAGGRFPLLVKFLDTAAPLSVQVHPSASDPAGGEAKTEAWCFLDAAPDAQVWLGLAPGTAPDALRRAAGSAQIVPLLAAWPARPGECALVRGGTVHAIGAGVLLLEVQDNSDTTHRLYDWDRPGLDGRPRPIHVESALRVAQAAPHEGPRAPQWSVVPGGRRARLADCESFTLDRVEAAGGADDDTRDLAILWVVLAGRGRLSCGAGTVELAPGDVWLVPAATGRHRLEPTGGTLSLLRIGTTP
ncbi:MAG: class I mannose-6-phosphate isomerase [Planctomycetes bacterium]|nr:class I mannose-6-phosphate isomerase [Planctomycetota bacterium]